MAEKSHYDILGVDRKASEADIKKAYRKLVRQYHPDVSNDPKADEKMGEINNAYETLKDSQKRKEYDFHLDNPFLGGGGGGFSGFGGGYHGFGSNQGFSQANMSQDDLSDILRQFGGGTSGFDDIFSTFDGTSTGFGGDGFGHSYRSSNTMKGDDQHAEVMIDLKDSYEGGLHKITIRLPINTVAGVDYQNKTLEVKIPKGIVEGQQIRLAKQGSPSPYGGERGDLYLKVKFKPAKNIRIEGKDVFQTVNITPWEAVFGHKIMVNAPTGKINIQIPKNSYSGKNLRLKGKGIPAKEAGDLFLQLNIIMPPLSKDEHRNEEQLQAWQFLHDVFSDFEPER